MKHPRLAFGLMAWIPVATAACIGGGETTFGPDNDDLLLLGTIVATTNTTGSSPDPNGYTVRVDESHSEPIDANGFVTFSSLKIGTYNVTLDQFEPNCVITGSNPVYVLLPADSTREAHFDVVCD